MMTERNEDIPSRDKKEEIYRPTKRDIKKYIPKEIRESSPKNLEGIKKRVDRINTEDIKKKEFFLKGCKAIYNKWNVLVLRAKEELRSLKRELPAHIRNIENIPERLEHLKGLLNLKNTLRRKEGEGNGSLRECERDLLESLKFVEHSIESELISRDDSKDRSIFLSYKTEELEEFIQDLEPKVRILREFLDKEFKKLEMERNTNLRKLFDMKE